MVLSSFSLQVCGLYIYWSYSPPFSFDYAETFLVLLLNMWELQFSLLFFFSPKRRTTNLDFHRSSPFFILFVIHLVDSPCSPFLSISLYTLFSFQLNSSSLAPFFPVPRYLLSLPIIPPFSPIHQGSTSTASIHILHVITPCLPHSAQYSHLFLPIIFLMFQSIILH